MLPGIPFKMVVSPRTFCFSNWNSPHVLSLKNAANEPLVAYADLFQQSTTQLQAFYKNHISAKEVIIGR